MFFFEFSGYFKFTRGWANCFGFLNLYIKRRKCSYLENAHPSSKVGWEPRRIETLESFTRYLQTHRLIWAYYIRLWNCILCVPIMIIDQCLEVFYFISNFNWFLKDGLAVHLQCTITRSQMRISECKCRYRQWRYTCTFYSWRKCRRQRESPSTYQDQQNLEQAENLRRTGKGKRLDLNRNFRKYISNTVGV